MRGGAQPAETCHVSDARRFLPCRHATLWRALASFAPGPLPVAFTVHGDAAPGAGMTLHPFDDGMGRQLARRQLEIGPACFVVLALPLHDGRLTPCVGIDTVILGVARLRQRHGVDAMLLVAAGAVADADADAIAGAELARLRELVRALAMKPHVRFLTAAPMNVLRDCHAAAHVLVSTPWRAADTGSTFCNWRKAVCNDRTGAVLPPHDAETLAACLARLQRLPCLAQATANAAGAQPADLATLPKPAFQ